MPSRKHIKPPPNFSFVTLESGAEETSWLKVHSSVARSHAAYWGGPHKHKRQTVEETIGLRCNTTAPAYVTCNASSSHDDTETAFGQSIAKRVPRRTLISPKTAKATTSAPKAGFESPRYIEPDHLRHLPSMPSEIRATGSPFAAGLRTLKFFGEGFVKRFISSDHEDYLIMFSGCLLLSYAHTMALTGHGTKVVLLQLKSRVIGRITAKIKSSGSLLSPRCLTAILALGAPIVCLVSRDLPNSLSMWDYINASMQNDYLCCPDSADKARSALEERIVHQQAIRRLFLKSSARFHDADNLALWRYVSNCMDISMALEAAGHLVDVGDLFPATDPCENCSIPACWTSPLTCQWLDETSSTHVEMQMLLLVGLTHQWLATFLDGDSRGLVPTINLLEWRAILCRKIESFAPVASTSTNEAEAMYECCRWASLILLTVGKLGVPIRIAAKHIQIQPRLTKRLRMTDLSNLWGIRKGLLFWIAAICNCATVGQCFPLLTATLFAQFSQAIAMSEYCSDIAIKPLKRLKQFESLCCGPAPISQYISTPSPLPSQL